MHFLCFRLFLSLCQTASRPYKLSHTNALRIDQFYEPKDQSMKFSFKTSLKAFSHQRRAKPFNTLRSKADLFKRRFIIIQFSCERIWPKAISSQKAISGQKPFLAENPFLAIKLYLAKKPFLAGNYG